MIVCLRTVDVPTEWPERYLAWTDAGRAIRQQHGILAELVCRPITRYELPGGYLNLPGLTTHHSTEESS